MPSVRDSLDQAGHARLERFLRQGAAAALTGTVRVSGRPGGAVHMRRGLVVGVASPGAPGVQALLVRTGRVGDEDWVRTGGDAGRAAGAIGAAHLNVIQVMAAQDAMFAMLAGTIDTCWFEEGRAVPARDGADPADLLLTGLRKLAALAALDPAILPHHERLAPVRPLPGSTMPGSTMPGSTMPGSALPGSTLPGTGDGHGDAGSAPARSASVRENILRYADGRRTARDIAFLSGRSLYAVTVEMSRMLGQGILREPPPPPLTGGDSGQLVRLVPRSAPPPLPDDERSLVRPELPRRQPAAGLTQDAAAQKTAAFWWDFLRLGGRAGESRT